MSVHLAVEVLMTFVDRHDQSASRAALLQILENQKEQLTDLRDICAELRNIADALTALLTADIKIADALMKRATIPRRDHEDCLTDLKDARSRYLVALHSGQKTPLEKAILHRSMAIASAGIGDDADAVDDLGYAEKHLEEAQRSLEGRLQAFGFNQTRGWIEAGTKVMSRFPFGIRDVVDKAVENHRDMEVESNIAGKSAGPLIWNLSF